MAGDDGHPHGRRRLAVDTRMAFARGPQLKQIR